MLPLLLLLFIVVPIVELALIIEVGGLIGVGWTVAAILAGAIAGSLLARAQGRAAWRRFSEAVSAGRPPAREVLDGALVLVGAALLLTPGFLTDAAGMALLLPPTRALARGLLVRRLTRRMVAAMTAPRAHPRAGARGRASAGPADVEGTAVDLDSTPGLPPRA